jgi:enoyl-CoA hydratase/carnithine racemase
LNNGSRHEIRCRLYEHLLISSPEPKIFQIVLNRPRQLTALAKKTIEELQSAISEFESSDSAVLLLTGAGRAFCFGADFQEFYNQDQLPQLLDHFQKLIASLYHCSKVTIACLNGFATGAGLDLALACDFRIADQKAKLGEAYISMGLVSDGGGSYILKQLVGMSRAMELLLLGEAISAQEALQTGLIHRMYASEELSQRALEFSANLADKPQTALRLIKKLLKQQSTDFVTALQQEAAAQKICFQDEAHVAILRDYLSRRKKDS